MVQPREGTAAYKALFEQIAPPDVLVCDGMKGIQRACAETWPDTRIQRCLVHVQRDTRADLTGKPRLQAGRELKRLADMLTRVHEPDAAVRCVYVQYLPSRSRGFTANLSARCNTRRVLPALVRLSGSAPRPFPNSSFV